MVSVVFFYCKETKQENLKKIRITGHVNESENIRNDLVCAGISTVIFGIANFLTRKKNTKDCKIRITKKTNHNEFEVNFLKNTNENQLVVEILTWQLKTVNDKYPSSISFLKEII